MRKVAARGVDLREVQHKNNCVTREKNSSEAANADRLAKQLKLVRLSEPLQEDAITNVDDDAGFMAAVNQMNVARVMLVPETLVGILRRSIRMAVSDMGARPVDGAVS